jgi:hypothetical protein
MRMTWTSDMTERARDKAERMRYTANGGRRTSPALVTQNASTTANANSVNGRTGRYGAPRRLKSKTTTLPAITRRRLFQTN